MDYTFGLFLLQARERIVVGIALVVLVPLRGSVERMGRSQSVEPALGPAG